ncbi:MAG: sortase [Bacilli bacterium]|nr:sortase [Bacilli bacterium]
MKKNKSWLLLIGSFLILGGISLIAYDYYSNLQINNQEEQAIEEFYKIEDEIEDITEEPQEIEEVKEQIKINYIAVLKIPKINLERGLVDPNSYLNNVNYNLEILNGSNMPDIKNGNLIIAGHSGSARISFFRNLDKLVLGDEIYIDYKNNTYKYKVVDLYDIEKTGTAEIIRDKYKSTLTLITCRHNTNKQIIVICEQF